jgi:hypothetical protein
MTSTVERLSHIRAVLVDSVEKMEEHSEISSIAKTNGHSKKKFDL